MSLQHSGGGCNAGYANHRRGTSSQATWAMLAPRPCAPAHSYAVPLVVVPDADVVVGRHQVGALGVQGKPAQLLAAALQDADGLPIEGVPVADLPVRACRQTRVFTSQISQPCGTGTASAPMAKGASWACGSMEGLVVLGRL